MPECENRTETKDIWLKYAVPFQDDDSPELCTRYAPISDACTPESFNKSHLIECGGKFTYDTPERTIASEWNITCEENTWRLTMVGTVNNLGQFFCLPLTGYVSDK